MPNWVTNKLKIEADEATRGEILETIKDDKLGRGSIDFGKLCEIVRSSLFVRRYRRLNV
jgi:hypothetical protein